MGLYQRSVLKNYLTSLDDSKVDDAYNEFKTFFFNTVTQQNIRNSKEEQFQEGFLRELFVKIMGYTLNPDANYNLISEQKNVSDAKKADGAILLGGKVIGVIELKGTNTIDLGKIQQQAFYYLSDHPKAVYVITSNFEKLRFYIQKSNDYEEFNLFSLSLEEFKLLYLCISHDSINYGIPLKIKQESIVKEEIITKQLYKDYSNFKNDLFRSLCDRNSHLDKLSLFKATQKLIDRFLFIFFCEDNNGLLPANSIAEIIKHWNKLREMDEYKPLYHIFKKYFEYINSGRAAAGEKREIFAFNGGLFAEDTLLDKLDIDDNVLYTHAQKLSTYDFISEVDVNILGHIFEHSLNDIEEIQAEIAGDVVDKSKTKRKKDGVFYTPKYITEYIVENTVGKLCADKKAELEIDEDLFVTATTKAKREPLLAKLNAYKSYLLSITICDPACGSGAFLNQAYVFLQKEHQYVADLESKLFDAPMVISDVSADILENNLFGVDINEESVEIARLALWLRSAKKGRKLNNLSNNIKCGNSLIDDPEVAGDKVFNWQKEFPQVFAKGGFDVVIGNPPYVFARDNFSTNEKSWYINTYESAKYQINTYLLFIEKTVHIIKNQGVYGLIIPNAWLMVYSGEGLRKFLLDTCTLDQIINLEGYSFESANVETVILLAKKQVFNVDDNISIYLNNGNEFYLSHQKKHNDFTKNDGNEFRVFIDDVSDLIISKLTTGSTDLDELTVIKAGLKAYETGKGTPKQTADDVKTRPFDYNFKFDVDTLKYLDGKNVGRYFLVWTHSFLRYGDHLAAPRTIDIFNGKKIIVREITGKYPKSIVATFTDDTYLFNMSNIAIVEKQNSTVDLKFILVLLNSNLMAYYFLKNTAKSVRKLFPKIILNDLRKFPIKSISFELQQPFIEKADNMLNLHQTLNDKQSKFISRIQSNLHLQNITGKIEKFYEHDFKSFVAELKKQNVILSIKDQDEWEDYFNSYKQEINNLQAEIARTDKGIDQMVYELYGLTEEEIRVVEGS
jgi:type I restriction-modification system DNA methylase subunit